MQYMIIYFGSDIATYWH